MKAFVLIAMLVLLAGCASGRSGRETEPGGADANARFAQQLRAAEGETFEARVDAQVQKEVEGEETPSSTEAKRALARDHVRGGEGGSGPGWEVGEGEGRIRRSETGLGTEFWVFAGVGALLLLYLIRLLMHRPVEHHPRSTVRVRY